MEDTSLTLHSFQGDFQTITILTVAAFCDKTVELKIIKTNDLKRKEYKRNLSLKRIPALQISESQWIQQTNAIVRYLARDILGSTPYYEALLHQFLDMLLTLIKPPVVALLASMHGVVQYDKKAVKMATDDLFAGLKAIERSFFQGGDCVIGTTIDIADLVLFTTIAPIFRGVVSFNRLNQCKKIKSWLEATAQSPVATKFTGRVVFANAPMKPPQLG